jgi:hypothetical protein
MALPFSSAPWPAALRLNQAAEYSGLSVDTFKLVCPVRPIEFLRKHYGTQKRKRPFAGARRIQKAHRRIGGVR